MLDRLYEEICEKIKNWAKWIFIIEAIAAVIGGIVLIAHNLAGLGLGTILVGPIVAWVGSWLLYAFGEMVETICSIFLEVSELNTLAQNKAAEAPAFSANGTKNNDGQRAKIPLVEGGWICSCGKTHMPYETSCVCGKTKAEAKAK